MEKVIWILGSTTFASLGVIHLMYTFFSDKFSSRNDDLVKAMKSSSIILSNETTVWKAWIGFNASHSAGAIFIGIVNIHLALFYFELFGFFLFSINIITVLFYLWLAKNYWFKVPFLGILFTLICYITAIII